MHPTIDVHAHVGHTVATGVGQTVEEMLARLSASGVAQALPSPAAANRSAAGILDTQRLNDVVAEAVRAHPDAFPAGLGLVEPRHEELAVAEAVRALDELGLTGLAMHPMLEGYYINAPRLVDPIFEVLDERGALCLMHCSPSPDSGESPRAIRSVATRFSGVTFFLGHAFLTEEQLTAAVGLVRDLPNVYLDVAYQSDPALTERLVREVGSGRVVFGTDQPFYDPSEVLASVLRADITDTDRAAVLHNNVAGVLSGLGSNLRA